MKLYQAVEPPRRGRRFSEGRGGRGDSEGWTWVVVRNVPAGAELLSPEEPLRRQSPKFTRIELNRGPGRDIVPGTGPGGFRVPDMKVFGPNASVAARGSIIEVKNVTRLYASRQLRDLVQIAEDFGCTVEIFTNATLPKTGKLAEWVEEGIVKIHPIP